VQTPKTSSTRLVLPRAVSASEPVNADAGTLSFDDLADKIRVKLSSGWADVGGGGGGGTITGVTAGTGLTGGGTSGTVTVAADFGAVSGKVTQGNDARLSDDRNPVIHGQTLKATPVGADEIVLADSAVSFANKRATLSSIAGLFTAGVSSFNGRTGAVVPQTGDYTAINVGLGNVTNDSQIKRAAGDFASFTTKATPVGADILLVEDSAASNAKKQITIASLVPALNAQQSGSFPLFATPATIGLTPGTADIEFDSTTLPGSMTIWDSTANLPRTVAGNTLLRGTLSGSNLYADAHTTAGGRASWLRMMVPNTNTILVMFPVTVPSSVVYWTRMKYFNNNTFSTGRMRFVLAGSTSGHPDPANLISVGLADGFGNLVTQSILAGTVQAVSGNGDTIQRADAPPEYFWIEKDGSTSPATYTLHAAASDGTDISPQQTFAANTFAPAFIGFQIIVPSNGLISAVHFRFDVDFIRQTTFPFMF